jgi:acetylornithine deacetylase/succinyl-diaminopimelate desuccinylase family protein
MTLDARIVARVDADHPAAVEFLRKLVRVPSDNPPGDCAHHAEVAAVLLEALGFSVERHPVPAAAAAAAGMVSAINLVVRHRFGPGPVIALNAHGDVVPPGAGWTREPYGGEVVDGAMYGRGVAVSKSDFATYAFALKALIDAGAPLAGTVELHLTYDEESGGTIGPRWLLDQRISRPDYVICAGFAYGIVTAHNGALHLEVTVRGKQAHAAMPATGIDALEAATGVLAALYAARRAYPASVSATAGIGSPQLNVGLIEGGINTNVVPDRVTFRLDRRIIPEERGAAVEADLRAIIARSIAGFPGATADVRRIMLAEPLAPVAGSERLIAPLARIGSEEMGAAVLAHGVPLYTDARHYAAAGIPTVIYGAGPRSILEANAHNADEHLQLDDLRRATRVIARTLAEVLAPA